MTIIADQPTLEESYPDAGIIATLKNDSSGREWSDALTSEQAGFLDLYAVDTYGERHLNKFGQKIGTNLDYVVKTLLILYGTKWDRLFTDYTVDYNPIWNVDGTTTETITRDLTQTHTGTDTTSTSGTDSTSHTGTDTTATSGTDSTSHTGTDTTAAGGTDSGTQTGTATTDHTGTDSTETNNETYGYNSADAVPADSTTTTQTLGTQDKLTNDLATSATYGRTDTRTEDLKDSTDYGRTDTRTENLKDSTDYGRTDTNTRDLSDTDKGTITTETTRGGNIGVTMTQQMLEADRDYWNNVLSLFYKSVLNDIITEITYKIDVD